MSDVIPISSVPTGAGYTYSPTTPTTSSPVTLVSTGPPTVVTSFSCTGTIVPWTVSSTGDYTISVSGAQGGSAFPGVGGNGANMTGIFFLTAGLKSIYSVVYNCCIL